MSIFESPEDLINQVSSDFFRGTSIWDLIIYTGGMELGEINIETED
ncbi:MAG: hypothetical protein PVG43_01920 [Nitrosopumilaceae archaeon]